MVKQFVRKTKPEDVEFLIDNIRPEDVIEIKAFSGATPKDVLGDEVTRGSRVWVVDDKVVCMFGVTPLEGHPKTGIIWLLATPDFYKHTKSFAIRCKAVFLEVIKEFEYVYNYVLAKNKDSVKWLGFLGFNFDPPKPIGKEGANFIRFDLLNV